MLLVTCLLATVLAKPDGYFYPQPPFQFDEPSTPHIPPQDEIPLPEPTYLPPPLNDLPPYDDSTLSPPNYLPPSRSFRILNMSCLGSKDGFFRTTFQTTPQSSPTVDSAPSCLIAPLSANLFRISLEGAKMGECGVRNCGTKMCLNVRMATVKGLRLAEDVLLNMQCVPQETVVSHTKHIRLNTQSEQGRSGGRSINVAAGGSQRNFETQISLLKKNQITNLFDQPIQQGGIVRLGDELMLRASVRDGDGWHYSRIGSVVIHSAASQKSVILIDEDGCRNLAMRSVCSNQPFQVNPLTTQFNFKAFLFQGAVSADDLLLSVRMVGCLRPRDCYQGRVCEDAQPSHNRAQRAVNSSTAKTTNWESDFRFKVLPQNEIIDISTSTISNSTIILLGIIVFLLFCIITVLVKKRC